MELRLGPLAVATFLSLAAVAAPLQTDDFLAEQAEPRELRVHFGDAVLQVRADGEPVVMRFLRERHPELQPAGIDRDGLYRFLVPPEHAERIAEHRATLAALGGTVGKTFPSPRLQELYKVRAQVRRAGERDVLGLIVRYRDVEKRKRAAAALPLGSAELRRAESITGLAMTGGRAMFGESYALRFATPVDLQSGEMAAQRLALSPDVERVDLDTRAGTAATPNDEFYGAQWNLFSATAGIRAPQAWDITTGSSSVVVGVVDSGILAHPDLVGRLLPGIDTITSVAGAQDGDGRDGDPTDAGTHGPASICGGTADRTSTWHGTHVAGIIAASGNNGIGIAGVDWRARIVPVRSLGRCGSGATSDIIDGIAWAAGLPVPGLATNANPARVVNASLSGEGDCLAYSDVLIQALRRGTLVVAAAGNNNRNALEFRPASCALALTVSAVGPSGDKASYSNFHAVLEVSAPGGQQTQARPEDGIASTAASGTAGSPGELGYYYKQGTSQAAPHAAGVAALMLSVAPTLTVAQMRDTIQQTSRAYPAGTRCALQGDCGAGLLDAAAAVARAQALNNVRTNYSALWFRPEELGWGVNLQQQGNILFGTWFTYNTDNSPVWLVMPSLNRVSDEVFSGEVYGLTGVPFNQIAGQSARRSIAALGTATVYFYNNNQALFVVTVNGATVVIKQLTVQLFASRPVCEFSTGSRASLTNFQDLWWNPTEDGWGINLTHQGDIIFATWFTYGTDGQPRWFVADALRRTGGNTFTGTLYSTTGRRPQDVSDTNSIIGLNDVGTMTVSFQDGERGTLSYTVQGTSGSKAIQRQVFSSPFSSCR